MKVIGIGDNVVDRYINKRIMFPGGNAVNFAVYAKECGADSAYMGVIAGDKEGELVRSSLEALHIDISLSVYSPSSGTERCDVELRNGDRVFVGTGYGGREHEPLKLSDSMIESLRPYDLVHCGCYADMEDEMVKIKNVSALKTYDFSEEPEFRTEEYLKKVCPYIDFALFSGAENSHEEITLLKDTCLSLGTPLVLITKGKEGQSLYTNETSYEGQIKEIDAIDTMGAGDSFFAAFIITLLKGGWTKDIVPSAQLINEAFPYAAEFSAENCLRDGAFGFATKY